MTIQKMRSLILGAKNEIKDADRSFEVDAAFLDNYAHPMLVDALKEKFLAELPSAEKMVELEECKHTECSRVDRLFGEVGLALRCEGRFIGGICAREALELAGECPCPVATLIALRTGGGRCAHPDLDELSELGSDGLASGPVWTHCRDHREDPVASQHRCRHCVSPHIGVTVVAREAEAGTEWGAAEAPGVDHLRGLALGAQVVGNRSGEGPLARGRQTRDPDGWQGSGDGHG